MATTKIWPVRDNLARVLDYAENHLKTANPELYTKQELNDLHKVLGYAADNRKIGKQHFVTGVNCIAEIAHEQMTITKQRFGKAGGNLAYHSYQSFLPNEVTPELCHEIGVELAKRIWGDKYEVLVTTHLDTNCIHNHMVINSVSFVDGKKLNNNYAMYFNNLRKQSDKICAEYGLSVIKNPGKAKNRYMEAAEKRGEPTIWNVVRSDIDEAIQCTMYDRQFYQVMKKWGYTFNLDPNRKYPTIRPPGSNKSIRLKTLGEEYTPESIKRRILEKGRPYFPSPLDRKKRYYRFSGNYKSVKAQSGIYIMFMIITMILRKIINHNRMPDNHLKKVRYTPEMREAIRNIDRYSKQTLLLCRHKIETLEQLQSLIDVKNQERSALERERIKIYNKMKSAKTSEKLAELKSERDNLSTEIKIIRTDLFLLGDVKKRSIEIRRKLLAQRELDYQRHESEKQKNKIKERGNAR